MRGGPPPLQPAMILSTELESQRRLNIFSVLIVSATLCGFKKPSLSIS